MANEADLLAAERSLRSAATVVGWTAYQLRQMWGQDLGMWGGAVTPVIHEGVGNSLGNSELLQTELLARADDCSSAADTARRFREAMVQYRRDLGTWNDNASEREESGGYQGSPPSNPNDNRWGGWPSWVSE